MKRSADARKPNPSVASLMVLGAVAALPMLTGGCPAKPQHGRKVTPAGRSGRTARSVCPRLSAPVRVTVGGVGLPRLPLPATIRFIEPERLPKNVSLQRLRRRASRYRRARRWRANTSLAALLWKMAHEKTRRAHTLEKSGTHEKKRIVLQREAHAHLRECVALLEQVLSEKPGFYPALVRLAYYARDLRAREAIRYFKKLVSHPKVKAKKNNHLRCRYGFSLARLLVAAADEAGALTVLKPLQCGQRAGAVAYLKAIALFAGGRFDEAAHALWAAARAVSGPKDDRKAAGPKDDRKADSARLRTRIARAWTPVGAMTARPAEHLKQWLSPKAGAWRKLVLTKAVALANKLRQFGRFAAARRVAALIRKTTGRRVEGGNGAQTGGAAAEKAARCTARLAKRVRYCLHRTRLRAARKEKKRWPRRLVLTPTDRDRYALKNGAHLHGDRFANCVSTHFKRCLAGIDRPAGCRIPPLPRVEINIRGEKANQNSRLQNAHNKTRGASSVVHH